VEGAELDIKIDVVGNPHVGDTIRVHIKVKNRSGGALDDLDLYFPFPADTYQNPTWTCNATGGSNCTGSGVGDVDDTVDMKKSGKVTYLVEAILLQPVGGIPVMGDDAGSLKAAGGDVQAVLRSEKPTFEPGSNASRKAGDLITLWAELSNYGEAAISDNPASQEFNLALPTGLDLDDAVIMSGDGDLSLNHGDHTVTWNGPIEPNETVLIQIDGRLAESAVDLAYLTLQGEFRFDADGDGSTESLSLTDDPDQPGAADPTLVLLKSVDVPVLTPVGLAAFLLGLVAAALFIRRRRRTV